MSARVVLIGPRGSGKTTVARLLAERLGVGWLDADALLVERAGWTVTEVFSREGESGFRKREAELLRELASQRDGHVLATGGGVVLTAENRAILKTWDAVVWLTADVDVLWGRIATDDNRPALLGGGRDEVERIVAIREPLYRECASFAVATGERSPEEAAAEIEQRLGSGAGTSRDR